MHNAQLQQQVGCSHADRKESSHNSKCQKQAWAPVPEVEAHGGELSAAADIGAGCNVAGLPDCRLAQTENAVVQHEQQRQHAQAKAGPPHLQVTGHMQL